MQLRLPRAPDQYLIRHHLICGIDHHRKIMFGGGEYLPLVEHQPRHFLPFRIIASKLVGPSLNHQHSQEKAHPDDKHDEDNYYQKDRYHKVSLNSNSSGLSFFSISRVMKRRYLFIFQICHSVTTVNM